jgi:hypothetical protein
MAAEPASRESKSEEVFGQSQKKPRMFTSAVYAMRGEAPSSYLGAEAIVNPGTTMCFSTLWDYLILMTSGGLNPNQTVSIPFGAKRQRGLSIF